jgi:predicted negative regulator of RcsB-dependent stress response
MAADPPQSPTPLAEISQGPGAFEEFLDRNQKSLIVFTVLLVIAAAALVVYRGVEKSRQHTAGAELSKAGDLGSLQEVINGHPGTLAAHSAAILLADSQWKDGRQDDAVTTLREFIDSNPDHPALATARAGLGSKLMSQGKNADAAVLFQEIVDDTRSRYLVPFAMISLGDLAKAAGDNARAETLYQRAKADFPESGFAGTAGERLASLNAKPPLEVDAPPPIPDTPPDDQAAAPDAGSLIADEAPAAAPDQAVDETAGDTPAEETEPETPSSEPSPENPEP